MPQLIRSEKFHTEGKDYLFNATPYIAPILDFGRGSFVWDVDGNKYLDLNSGQFCLSFGHDYEPFFNVVLKQMKRIYHTNTSTLTPEVYFAARDMAEIMGGELCKTFFLSTGSEANECALRYAQFATHRNVILCLDIGYHGLTLGSQAATMGGKWAMPHIPSFISVSTPDFIHSRTELSEEDFVDTKIIELKKLFADKGDSIAAFILEPIIGVGGMVQIPEKYLMEARALCDEYGALLIFDECQCGFARSGDWFVFQQANVQPDIVTTAKAMGMGLAVSAVTFSKTVAQQVEGKLIHFSSHQNDPVSSAIVSFVINEIKRLNILKRNRENGLYLLSRIQEICGQVDFLVNPRGVGLMCAFDIDDQVITEYRDFSSRFISQLLRNGILIQSIRQGRTFRIMPSYLTDHDEIDFIKDMVIMSAKEMD